MNRGIVFIILVLVLFFFALLFFANSNKLRPERVNEALPPVLNEPEFSAPVIQATEKISTIKCTLDECLTSISNDDIYGTANISGYYVSSIKKVFDKKSTCDEFVITGGSLRLKEYFSDLVKAGNTVNRLDAEDKPVININLSNLTVAERGRLIRSTVNHSVAITVLKRTEAGAEASTCFSFVDILRVE